MTYIPYIKKIVVRQLWATTLITNNNYKSSSSDQYITMVLQVRPDA